MSVKKEILNAEQAIALLNEGDRIHTFMNPNGMLLGCDWDRDEVIRAIKESKLVEVGGEQCVRMKHGLVVWLTDDKPLFVESKAGL